MDGEDNITNPLASPRFCGLRSFMRLPHHRRAEADIMLVGAPFDTGASFRVGARFAPQAIRQASVLLRPYHPQHQLNIFSRLSGADYGDINVVPGNIQASYQRITSELLTLLKQGVIPVVMGGDHSITLPVLRAIKEVHGSVALLQFDAHSDTWDRPYGELYSHSTPILRAIEEELILPHRSIQVGIRGSANSAEELEIPGAKGLRVVTITRAREQGVESLLEEINQRLAGERVYLTFDIDAVDPAYAPGTGTPEVGGFTSFQIQQLLRGLAGNNFVGSDLVEVLPAYDCSEVTALLAANIIHEFLALLALNA